MLTETEGPPAETSIHLRRGKWSVEEENYANKIISLFNQGKLSILPGTTLRSFLSEKLQCDPMRITKKYAGKSCIGKQIYQPCDGFQESIDSIREAEKELEMFEKIFLNKIQAKAAASAALQSPLHSARTPSQRLLLKQVGSSEDLSRKNVSDAMDVEEDKEQESSSDHNDANSNDSSEENESNVNENDRFLTASSLPVPKTIFASLDRPIRSTSTKKHSFYRRNMSAPNLSSLPISKIGLSSENSNTNYEEANDKVQIKRVTDEFLLMGGRIPFYSKGENPYLSTAPSSITAKKRSHSVMALMDFEKLVSDDKAAGDLFYEFITMVGDINSSNKRQYRQVSTKDGLPFRDDTNLLQSKKRSGVKVGAKLTVNIEEEESSNHSRETVVHKYEQKDGHFNSQLESHLVVMETDARHKHSDVAGEESVMVVHQQLTSHILQDDSTDDCDNFF